MPHANKSFTLSIIDVAELISLTLSSIIALKAINVTEFTEKPKSKSNSIKPSPSLDSRVVEFK